MWWNGSGWGHMYGWWLMPLFGIVCMVIFLYIISRIFSSGGFCGRHSMGNDQGSVNELKEEIHELRKEITALRESREKKEDRS